MHTTAWPSIAASQRSAFSRALIWLVTRNIPDGGIHPGIRAGSWYFVTLSCVSRSWSLGGLIFFCAAWPRFLRFGSSFSFLPFFIDDFERVSSLFCTVYLFQTIQHSRLICRVLRGLSLSSCQSQAW